jgi:hypothetical protein
MDERIDDLLNDLFDIYAQPGTFGLEMDRNEFLAACEDLLDRIAEGLDSPGLTE